VSKGYSDLSTTTAGMQTDVKMWQQHFRKRLDSLVGQVQRIIIEALKGPVGFVALTIMVLSTIGYFFLVDASHPVRISIVVLMFLGCGLLCFSFLKEIFSPRENLIAADFKHLAEFFKRQQELLEALLPPGWFHDRPDRTHPAYVRWSLCQRVLDRGGVVRFPDDQNDFAMIARMILDSIVLAKVSGSDPKPLGLGDFSLYGDSKVTKKILSRVTDPRQFEDVLVELAFGAWHKTRNHDVTPLEEEGLPDLKLRIADAELPIYAECKRLTSRSKNRFSKVLRKANNQIKAASERCYGIAVLDVSTLVSGRKLSDTLPSEIQAIRKIVKPIISGAKNRSVGGVVLIWDEYTILGNAPAPTSIFLRRRHIFIPHSPETGTETIPDDLKFFEGFTVLYKQFWEPKEE